MKVPMYPPATVVDDSTIFYGVEGGIQGDPELGESVSITGAIMRKLFAVQPDPWDVTGSASPAIPEFFSEASAVLVSDTHYAVTPLDGPTTFKMTYGNSYPAPVSGQQWADFQRAAYDVGDNITTYGLGITNQEATASDLLAAFASFPTLTGTVQWILYAVFDHQSGLSFGILVTSLGIADAFPAPGIQPEGTQLFLGIDYDNNQFVRDIGGVVTTITPAFTIAGSRQFFLAATDTPTPVFNAGSFPVSFSSTAVGKTGFVSIGDAIAPLEVLDGKRYLVQNTGTFNGKTLTDGDVAEFFNNATEVFVVKADTLTIEEVNAAVSQALVATVPTLLTDVLIDTVLSLGRIDAVVNSASIEGVDDEVFIVGPYPNGNFSTYTAGTLVIRKDNILHNLTTTRVLGVLFSFRTSFGSPYFIRCIDDGGLGSGPDEPYYSPYGGEIFSEATEQELRSLGWVLVAPPGLGYAKRRFYDYSGFSSGSIYQGTAEYHDVVMTLDFTLFASISLSSATIGVIRILNTDSVPHNLYLGASTYSMAAGEQRFFMAIGHTLTGVQFTALLSP